MTNSSERIGVWLVLAAGIGAAIVHIMRWCDALKLNALTDVSAGGDKVTTGMARLEIDGAAIGLVIGLVTGMVVGAVLGIVEAGEVHESVNIMLAADGFGTVADARIGPMIAIGSLGDERG